MNSRRLISNMGLPAQVVGTQFDRPGPPAAGLSWTAAAMHEAKKGFRRLKAYKQLPALRAALAAHYDKQSNNSALAQKARAA